MKFLNKLKAFTLAEVMITLVVIGIIAAVVIPVAIQSKPDENIMKFKKAHNTLYQTIRTLINLDRYYKDGDLGVKANGELIDGTHDGDKKYFCNSFSDVLSIKKSICTEDNTENTEASGFVSSVFLSATDGVSDCNNTEEVNTWTNTQKNNMDSVCKRVAAKTSQRIITTDGITFYEGNPRYTYGMPWKDSDSSSWETTCMEKYANEDTCNRRLFGTFIGGCNAVGDRIYKLICIDIDGIPNGGSDNCDDDKDICPFGYGITSVGHIMIGARANEWLKKDFREEKKQPSS